MKFSGQLSKFKVDESEVIKRLAVAIRSMQREAGKEFIRSAQKRIPVLTGQAKGTLIPLAEELGILTELDFTPNSPHLDQRAKLQARGQSPATGAMRGRFDFTETEKNYILTIENDLEHYERWENQRSSGGRGRWLSFAAGALAFKRYVKQYGHAHLLVFAQPGVIKRDRRRF